MSRIELKLETITPVHVGTGESLYPKEDYRYHSRKRVIQILKPGTREISREMELFPDNVDIQNKGTGGVQIREMTRNGMGLPYIPGSSIKGAIRTSILAELVYKKNVDGNSNDLQNIISSTEIKSEDVADRIEKKLFGVDPNHDLFRFLTVSDAMFSKNMDCVQRTYTPIKLDSDGKIDQKNPLFEIYVGAIKQKQIADNFSISFRDNFFKLAKENKFISERPDCFNSIQGLFEVINDHTYTSLGEELEIFKYLNSDKNVDSYCDQLVSIQKQIPADNSYCILRVGFGSGWKGITGNWVQDFDGWEKRMPDNYNVQNVQIFPRTRRTAQKFQLMGYIKIGLK